MQDVLLTIANRIKQAKSVLILSHMRPDGDAFGSALALCTALDNLGIAAQVCIESDIPSHLSFVSGIERVQKKPKGEYDLLVAVDCADVARFGVLADVFWSASRKMDTVNIDHHVSNPRFAKYNYVGVCASNCMNIAKLITYMGAPFDKKTAEYLLLGLLTDSGNFSHDDVTEETLLLAAKAVAAGADIRHYNYQLFKSQPKARAALHASVMAGMRYFFDDRFALITITQEAISRFNADAGMTEGFVDFPLSVDSVEVAASLMEVKPRQYKVSLRSKNYADVNAVAGRFGGGGHVRASGCMLFGELEEVIDRLSYTVSQYLQD